VEQQAVLIDNRTGEIVTADDAWDDLETTRQFLIRVFGFELYADPYFVERLVCKLGGLEQTDRGCPYDGMTCTGIKVEIKHSNAYRTADVEFSDFTWHHLQGTNGAGKGADVFVLVGYDDLCPSGGLRFWVVPALVLEGIDRLRLSLSPRRCAGRVDLSRFACNIADIKDAIVAMAQVGSAMKERLDAYR